MSAARDTVHPSDRLAVKAAFGRMIAAIGGLERAAAHVRVGRSSLSDYQSRNVDSFAPVDVVMALEAVCPDGPCVTAYLARHAGHVLIKLPDCALSLSDYMQAIGEIMQRSGGLCASTGSAIADHRVSPKEKAGLTAQIDDLIENLVGYKMALEAEHG